MNDVLDVRDKLFERYGIEPERVDVSAAELLLTTLDTTTLDVEAVEAAVVAAAVNGESHFLRHHEQFEWLVATWLPAALARVGPVLRVLSAACSTGEEPYSLAATLGPRMPARTRLEILALDVSEQALAAARVGHYGLWSLRGLEPGAHDWLDVEGQRVVVSDRVKDLVRFETHNLLEPLHTHGRFDLVLCRNMLIYLHDEAIDRVWRNLAEVVDDEGVLLVAPGDPHPRQEIGLCASWQGPVCVFSKQAPDPVASAPPERPPVRAPTRRAPVRRTPTRAKTPAQARPPAAQLPPQPPTREADVKRATILRLVQAGELELARDLLIRLTEAVPLHVPSHILLALVAAELDEPELYAAHARKAGYLAPDEPYPVFVMAAALERLGHRDQAERRYRWAAGLLAELDERTPLRYGDGLLAGQLEDILDGRA